MWCNSLWVLWVGYVGVFGFPSVFAFYRCFSSLPSFFLFWCPFCMLRGTFTLFINFFTYQKKVPHNCYWCWRKLMKIRDVARRFLQYKFGDGRNIFLWRDLSHPDGVLYEVYGHRVVYDSWSTIDSKLDSVLRKKVLF